MLGSPETSSIWFPWNLVWLQSHHPGSFIWHTASLCWVDQIKVSGVGIGHVKSYTASLFLSIHLHMTLHLLHTLHHTFWDWLDHLLYLILLFRLLLSIAMIPWAFHLASASTDTLFPASWSIYLSNPVSRETRPHPCPIIQVNPGLHPTAFVFLSCVVFVLFVLYAYLSVLSFLSSLLSNTFTRPQ